MTRSRRIYLEAARRIAEGENNLACMAIDDTTETVRSPARMAFDKTFRPQGEEGDGFHGMCWLAMFGEAPHISRHRRVIALCLAAVALAGCATPDVMCDHAIKANTAQIADSGDIRLKWKVVPKSEIAGLCFDAHSNGCAHVFDGFTMIYIAERPQFPDTCKLAVFGHEVSHALGAQHARGDR